MNASRRKDFSLAGHTFIGGNRIIGVVENCDACSSFMRLVFSFLLIFFVRFDFVLMLFMKCEKNWL